MKPGRGYLEEIGIIPFDGISDEHSRLARLSIRPLDLEMPGTTAYVECAAEGKNNETLRHRKGRSDREEPN